MANRVDADQNAPGGTDLLANSVDPDQTTPVGKDLSVWKFRIGMVKSKL